MVFEFSRRKLVLLLSILVVLVAVPITLYLSQRNQLNETRSHASNQNPVVVTIAGKQYFQSDIDKLVEEGIDTTAAKDNLIERAILDSVASDEGINVDQSEIDQVSSDEGVSAVEARYEILRNKIILSKVRYVKAISVGYWEPLAADQSNYTSEEWAGVQQQLSDGNKAIESAASSLASSDDVMTIASDLVKTYPSLTDVLAVNGLIFSTIDESDKTNSASPALYQYGASNFDPETLDKVFAASNKVGDVISVSNTSASAGGSAFKITEIGTGTEDSYDSWLAKEKARP